MANTFFTASRWATRPLRQYITDTKGVVRPMSLPNATTLSYSAPLYLKYTVIDYSQFSKNLISKIQKKEMDQSALVLADEEPIQAFPLLNFNPYLQPKPIINTEADVVREANIELITWATLTLEHATDFTIRVLSEPAEKNTRPDMVWYYVVPGNSADKLESWKPFAVLEFKKAKMIDIAGFQSAVFHERPGLTEDSFYQIALQAVGQTLLGGDNAL